MWRAAFASTTSIRTAPALCVFRASAARLFASRAGAAAASSSSSTSSSPLSTTTMGASPSRYRPTAPASSLSHHLPGGGFCNPPEWGSHKDKNIWAFFTEALPEWDRSTAFPPLRTAPVDFAALATPSVPLQALFVGHATFFLQARGVHVLTDPFFSDRPSPVSWIGPKRFSPPACSIAELPPVDVVLLSHSHYDHLDAASVGALLRKAEGDRAAHPGYAGLTWCAPLGVGALLEGLGVPRDRIRCLDWWEEAVVEGGRGGGQLRVACVPAQHNSARTPWDRNHTLWCGFACTATEGPAPAVGGGGGGEGGAAASPTSSTKTSSFYFSGDTGYRVVEKGVDAFSEAERAAPKCPAFAEIGERHGPFDLALLPVGAYSPRTFMSSVHASPSDAVEMFSDVKAKHAIAMHWGALPLTDEPPGQPVEWLKEALSRAGGEAVGKFVALLPGGVWPHAKPL